ncbi:amino acid adenylation domain-containing protein [Tolypothrix sp. NIES-4075]|uniref:amino acid adenylation domain-containing protein n=1 Tax=Tolypothrix sp. NIES-4075 TaxID=2005459 RepID=UPI000B5C9D76|nr:non-ribosomal peptide synthetase [Tolypothrix sp. NIES-4075]GAX45367.1 amino acid adenylation domain-containing protein [Tolypothrix sp. NIES-4075]
MKNKNVEDFYPLSPMQQGIFFHSLAAPDQSIYFEQFSWTIQGKLNITAFHRAWEYIVERHSILRTCFVWQGLKEPVQIVYRQVKLPWVVHDLREISSVKQQEHLEAFLSSDRSVGFELTHPPLMRFTLHHKKENLYQFTWSHHHLLLDGWSVAIIYKEVFDCYQAFSNGQDIHLEPILAYRDYIVWLQKQNLSQAEAFWRQLLKGFTSPTQIGVNKGFGQLLNSQDGNNQQKIKLSVEQTAALQFWAQQHQLTLNTVVQGAWALLLSRYSGQEDVVFGATTSGRPPTLASSESMVGLLINTLPVRVKVSSAEFLLPWLKQIQTQQIEARQYEYSPLLKIQGWSEVPKGLPLFESIVVFENYPVDASLRKLDLNLEIKSFSAFAKTNYPLALLASPGEELSLRITYDGELFDADTISQMGGQFEYLLQQMVTEPDRSIQSYSLVTAQSRSILPDSSAPLDEPDYEPVPALFAAWAQQAPEQPAIRHSGQTWTYQELAQSAHEIALVLLNCGVQPQDVVALSGPKSFGLIASMLGVFKSGAVLLMLEMKPNHRQQLMLEEAQVKYILNVGTESPQVESSLEITRIDAETARVITPVKDTPKITSLPTITPGDRAYIFFTSGSTGTPKGVLGTHKGISHFLQWQRQTFEIGSGDRVAQLTSLTFDAVLRDVFLPLTSGATLCLPNQDDDFGMDRVLSWLETEQITLVHTVPALAQSWLKQVQEGIHLRSLRWIFFSGEPLTQTLVHQWRQTFPEAGEVVNLYGATETTMVKCFYKVPKDIPTDAIPVGWALPQTQALVLNQINQLCGIGEIGEIAIRTSFRTLGYINAPQEQQRFVPNPLSNDQQDLFYYTGDRGRYRPDGALEVLGRLDDQIKIRGIRVQPGEISTVLNQHPAVAESVIIATGETLDNKRLVAYVVAKPNQTIDKNDLRYFLKKQLPQYLVPSVFVVLDALPLTPNGKVNRHALPEAEQNLSQHDRFVPPRDRLELHLTQIWSEVLNVNQVSVLDNFFELGGHSLLAVSLMTRIQHKFGQSLPLKTLFQEATVEQQAMLLRQQTENRPWSPLVTIQPRGSKRPLFFIHPSGGSIFNYLNLAQYLGTERPLYGLEASGRDREEEPHSHIEEMAAHYIKAIQIIQPEDPYLLAGWSMGGAIAFEMAQQLQDQGKRISLLALIDASDIFADRFLLDETNLLVSLFRTRLSFSEEQLPQVEANLRQMDTNEQLAYAISQAREHNPQVLPPGFGVEQLGRLFKVIKFHTGALKNYSSQLDYSKKYYSGKITLLQANEGNFANYDNPTLGWEALADKVEVHWVPGNHLTVVQEPHVKVLAEKLQICLEQAQAEN